MYNPYTFYLMYVYLKNIYGVYVTLRFLKYIFGYMYDFFMYLYSFIRKEEKESNIKLICDKRKSTYTEL